MESQALLGLGTKLLDIDEQRFRQVVGLLEHMGDHPDVQKTFSLIRPRLVELKPRRRPTMKRLFCEPFEDLFEPLDRSAPAPLKTIERDVVNGLWPLVEAQIGKERVKSFSGALRPVAEAPDGPDMALAFWTEAGEAVALIAGQFEAGRFAEDLKLRLTPDRVRAVGDIARILSIAGPVAELKAVLAPHPVVRLHQDHLAGVQEIGRKVAKSRPEALKIFILLAAARLADPSLLLGGLWNMELGQKSGDRAALFLELSGTVITQIEERSRVMKQAPRQSADRLAVADLAAGLVASLEATRSAMEQSRNSSFDQRLKAVRGSVHEMVRSQILEGATGDILEALEEMRDGTMNGAAPAQAAETRDQLLRAENHARALRKCATIADTLGLRGELKAVTQKTLGSLTDTARQLLGRGAGSAPPASGSRAGFTAVRMIELIAGPAEANQIMNDVLNGKP